MESRLDAEYDRINVSRIPVITHKWAAENYCLFLADNEGWEENIRMKAKAVEDLGCKVWLNTE